MSQCKLFDLDEVDVDRFREVFSHHLDEKVLFDGGVKQEDLVELVGSADCFLSYCSANDQLGRDTNKRADQVVEGLKSRGLITWSDCLQQQQHSDDNNDPATLSRRVRHSRYLVILLTEKYLTFLYQESSPLSFVWEAFEGSSSSSSATAAGKAVLVLFEPSLLQDPNRWKSLLRPEHQPLVMDGTSDTDKVVDYLVQEVVLSGSLRSRAQRLVDDGHAYPFTTCQTDYDHRIARINQCIISKETERAIEELTRLSQQTSALPEEVRVYHTRAILQEQSRRLLEAIEDETRVVNMSPQFGSARIHRARLNRSLGNYMSALRDYYFAAYLYSPEAFEEKYGKEWEEVEKRQTESLATTLMHQMDPPLESASDGSEDNSASIEVTYPSKATIRQALEVYMLPWTWKGGNDNAVGRRELLASFAAARVACPDTLSSAANTPQDLEKVVTVLSRGVNLVRGILREGDALLAFRFLKELVQPATVLRASLPSIDAVSSLSSSVTDALAAYGDLVIFEKQMAGHLSAAKKICEQGWKELVSLSSSDASRRRDYLAVCLAVKWAAICDESGEKDQAILVIEDACRHFQSLGSSSPDASLQRAWLQFHSISLHRDHEHQHLSEEEEQLRDLQHILEITGELQVREKMLKDDANADIDLIVEGAKVLRFHTLLELYQIDPRSTYLEQAENLFVFHDLLLSARLSAVLDNQDYEEAQHLVDSYHSHYGEAADADYLLVMQTHIFTARALEDLAKEGSTTALGADGEQPETVRRACEYFEDVLKKRSDLAPLEVYYHYARLQEARGELRLAVELSHAAVSLVHLRSDAIALAQLITRVEAQLAAEQEYLFATAAPPITSVESTLVDDGDDGGNAKYMPLESFLSFMHTLSAAVLARTAEYAAAYVDQHGYPRSEESKHSFQEGLLAACDGIEKQLLEQKGLSSAEMQRLIRHYQDSSDELRRIMGNMQIESYFILQSHGIAFS